MSEIGKLIMGLEHSIYLLKADTSPISQVDIDALYDNALSALKLFEINDAQQNKRIAELEQQLKAKDDQIGIYLEMIKSKDALLARLMRGCSAEDGCVWGEIVRA